MALLLPLAALGATLAGTFFSARQASKEAQKNRDFQERMSNTEVQRYVADARSSGLHPSQIAGMRGGASTPSGAVADVPDFGEAAGRSIANALAIRQAKAQIDLTSAQSQRETAQAVLLNQQAQDLHASQPARLALGEAQAQLAASSLAERRDLVPVLLQKARLELGSVESSTRAAAARAALDEFQASGFENVAKFEKQLGQAGPWMRLLFEAVRSLGRVR